MNWKAWVYHLVSAGISGAANSALASFVDPSSFNFTSARGWEHVGALTALGFLVPVLSILKQGLPEPPQKT